MRYLGRAAVARGSWPPFAALALVLLEGAGALVGLRWWPFSAFTLIAAPGLALQPALPRELGPLGRWVAVPVVGCAAASILIISESAMGAPLTGFSVRLVLVLAAAGGIAWVMLAAPKPVPRGRSQAHIALGLVAVLCLAVALQGRVIGGDPVPGTDWGHYLLYPDQIARHGTMNLDNPFWMRGGQPFRDDPGAASLYGGFLIMSKADASILAHGIWVFALLSVASVFLLASALSGPAAGLTAAAVYAVIPMNQTMLGWHGLSNELGLMLLPLVLLGAVWVLRTRAGPGPRWAFLLALLLVALAAAHRLTLLVAVIALILNAVAALALSGDRRALLRFGLRTAAFAVPLGLLVLIDLQRRGQGSGGVQSYRTYLVTKVNVDLTVSDLTIPVVAVGVLALIWLAVKHRRDPGVLVLHALAASALLLAYGWIVHLPTVYYRMVYFLPLALAPAIGVALVWLARTPLSVGRFKAAGAVAASLVGVALVLATGVTANDRGPTVRSFYAWASDASVKGLAEVQARTSPRDTVVADRCWGFLAPWLLQRPVLAGIDPADILPSWEAHPASVAREILYGSPRRARATARRYGARYAVLNPGCASDETNRLRVPSIGEPVYESTRLVVLDLGTGPGR